MQNENILLKGIVTVDGNENFKVNYVISKTSINDWLKLVLTYETEIQSIEFSEEIGFYTYDLTKVIQTLNDFEYIILNDETNIKVYNILLGFYNFSQLSLNDFENISNTLNLVMETEEIGIINDFSQYEFTINDYFLKMIEYFLVTNNDNFIFSENSNFEIQKYIIHKFIKSWLLGRYTIKNCNGIENTFDSEY